VRVVADANVLLSALIGGRARAILVHPAIEEVLTTETVLAEVQEYAGELARKRRLAPELVLLAASTLPVSVVRRPVYSRRLKEAEKRIGRRDPDDVDLLALALEVEVPIWSNDNDFKDVGVPWFTTAALLARIGGL
jgi:predicted nucleic acid-binding protein